MYNKHVVSFPRAPVLAFPFPQEALLLLLEMNVHFLCGSKFKEVWGQQTQSQAGFGVDAPSHPSFLLLPILSGLRLPQEGGVAASPCLGL